MKSLLLVCLTACIAVALAGRSGYTDKFDNVNLDEVMGNRRLMQAYIECILDLGKCSPEGKELKAHIREALEENCAKCTEKQRAGARRVLGHLINNEPTWWGQLVDKYDPQRKYMHQYEEDLKTIRH